MATETNARIEKTIKNMLSAFNERDVELTLSCFYFDENFLSYGMDGSRSAEREEWRKLLENEFNRLSTQELEVKWSKISVYRTMATFVAECSLVAKDQSEWEVVPLRMTAVLREINDRWKINQLYFSTESITRAA